MNNVEEVNASREAVKHDSMNWEEKENGEDYNSAAADDSDDADSDDDSDDADSDDDDYTYDDSLADAATEQVLRERECRFDEQCALLLSSEINQDIVTTSFEQYYLNR